MVLKYDSATNTFRDPSENAVAASFYNQKATTQDIIKKTASHRGGGRGGGGSSTQGFSTMYPTETSPLIPSPQAQSQAAQDLSRTLARQNLKAYDTAIQRDTNYMISTQLQQPVNTFYPSGTMKDTIPSAPKNPFTPIASQKSSMESYSLMPINRTGIPGITTSIFSGIKETALDLGRGLGFVKGTQDFSNNFFYLSEAGKTGSQQAFIQKTPMFPNNPALSGIVNVRFTGETKGEAKTRLEREAGFSENIIGLPTNIQQSKIVEQSQKDFQKTFETDVGGSIMGVQKYYQGKIDTGEIEFETATSQFKTFQESFISMKQEKYQKDFQTSVGGKLESFGLTKSQIAKQVGSEMELGTRTGKTIIDISPVVLEAGALTAASFTPTGLALGSVYLGGKGISEVTTSILGTKLSARERIVTGAMGVANLGFSLGFARAGFGGQKAFARTSEGLLTDIKVSTSLFERNPPKELFMDLETKGLTRFAPIGKPTSNIEEGFIEQRFLGTTKVKNAPGIIENIDFNLKSFELPSGKTTLIGTGTREVSYKTIWGETINLAPEKIGSSTAYPISSSKAGVSKVTNIGDVSTGLEGYKSAGTMFSKIGKGESFFETPFVSASVEGKLGDLVLSGKTTKIGSQTIKASSEGFGFGENIYSMTGEFVIPRTARANIKSITFFPKEFTEDLGKVLRTARTAKGSGLEFSEKPTDLFSRLDTKATDSTLNVLLRPKSRGLKFQESTRGLQTLFGGSLSGIPSVSAKQLSAQVFSQGAKQTSLYAGLGTYELTRGGRLPKEFQIGIGNQLQIEEPQFKFKNNFNTLIAPTVFQPTKEKNIFNERSSFFPTEVQNLGRRQISDSFSAQSSGLKELQLTKLTTRQLNPPAEKLTPFGGFDFGFAYTTPKTFTGLDIPSLGGFAIPTGKSRGRKSNVWNIAPSFTGIIGNIQMTSPLKVSKTYGVTPFQTRGLFVGKKSKSQPYYQLTDL